ncbi:MAG: hypothetical protein WB773_32005, partial [Isosphaeraceae bacterium]
MSTQPSRSMRREPPFRKSRSTICCNFHLGLAGWLIPIPGLFARVGHIDRSRLSETRVIGVGSYFNEIRIDTNNRTLEGS